MRSYRIKVDPKPIWLPYKKRTHSTQGESHVTMKAETEVIYLPVNEHQGLSATPEAKHGTDFSLVPSERAWPC